MDLTGVEQREAIMDFIDEALLSLRGLPAQLDSYRSAPADPEPVNAVFRAIHSIKGCSSFLGLDAIRAFSHALENSLDVLRTELIPLQDSLEQSLVQSFDRLDVMLQEAAGGKIATLLEPEDTRVLEDVKGAVSQCRQGGSREKAFLNALDRLADRMDAGHQDLRPFSRDLRGLLKDYAPSPSRQEPEPAPSVPVPRDFLGCHFTCDEVDATDRVADLLQFFFDFADGRNSDEREQLFLESLEAFGAWAKAMRAAELEQAIQAATADFRIVRESPLDFDDNLVLLVWQRLAPALESLRSDQGRPSVASNVPDHAPPVRKDGQPSPPSPESGAKLRFVRVKEENLDSFLEHVSRMFILSDRFRDVQSRMADTGQWSEMVDELRQVNMDLKVQSTALQQGVMALRRVAVGGLFSKFPRMARLLASQLEKQIHVTLVGEETEIDKQLAEDLDSALTHLVRNVVDHGIEPPDQRTASGKPEAGNLQLEAVATRNQVTILVRDDGRGMDPARLRAKAVQKGMLSQAQADAMSSEDALQLIFLPGFSTAQCVTEVSGRGVGMDVVRSVVQEHHGNVLVESRAGQGTTIRLQFPVRHATLVIDGLMVAAGTEQFVIPFEHIRQIIQVDRTQIQSVHGRPVVTFRDTSYDAVHVGDLMAVRKLGRDIDLAEMAVLVHSRSENLCVLVDKVVGHRQVVVTPLAKVLPESTRLTGIAQLGAGRLAPVLNISEILKNRV